MKRAAIAVVVGLATSLLACSGGQGCKTSSATAAPAANAPAYRVLFLGNSYTFVGDVPGRVRDLATQVSPPVKLDVDSIAIPGKTLHELYDRPDVHAKIASGHWTHVVLQDQSTDPLRAPNDFRKYARLLADEARNAGATPVFYQTWARREGDELYKDAFAGGSFAAMQAKLDAAYQQAATDSHALLAPVGDARARALTVIAERGQQATLPLYIEDGSHPTSQGAYLGACVIFRTIAGLTTVGAKAPTEFSSDVARELQTFADGVPMVMAPPSSVTDR